MVAEGVHSVKANPHPEQCMFGLFVQVVISISVGIMFYQSIKNTKGQTQKDKTRRLGFKALLVSDIALLVETFHMYFTPNHFALCPLYMFTFIVLVFSFVLIMYSKYKAKVAK